MKNENLSQFIKDNEIKILSEWVARNPYMDWSKATHYKVTLLNNSKEFVTYFSKGLAYGDEKPKVEEVLESLSLDNREYLEGYTLDDFVSDYGYNEDSKELHLAYNSVMEIGMSLEDFLGKEQLDRLAYNIEF